MNFLFYVYLALFVFPGMAVVFVVDKVFDVFSKNQYRGKKGIGEFISLCFWVGLCLWMLLAIIIGMIVYYA